MDDSKVGCVFNVLPLTGTTTPSSGTGCNSITMGKWILERRRVCPFRAPVRNGAYVERHKVNELLLTTLLPASSIYAVDL